MKNRWLVLFLSAVLFLSCSHFVNLGDDKSASADNTEGLPSEISDDDRQPSDNGNGSSGDWGDTWSEDEGDTDAADNGEEVGVDTGNTAADTGADSGDWEGDTGDCGDTGADTGDTADAGDEPGDTAEDTDPVLDSETFTSDFKDRADCGCGSRPDYAPVCCTGNIAAFNTCFANCYAVKSGNKICTSYTAGPCQSSETADDDDDIAADEDLDDDDDIEENDDDADTEVESSDEDAETPDSDEETIGNECGCYPEQEIVGFKCSNGIFYTSSCLMECQHCEEADYIF